MASASDKLSRETHQTPLYIPYNRRQQSATRPTEFISFQLYNCSENVYQRIQWTIVTMIGLCRIRSTFSPSQRIFNSSWIKGPRNWHELSQVNLFIRNSFKSVKRLRLGRQRSKTSLTSNTVQFQPLDRFRSFIYRNAHCVVLVYSSNSDFEFKPLDGARSPGFDENSIRGKATIEILARTRVYFLNNILCAIVHLFYQIKSCFQQNLITSIEQFFF